MLQNSYDHSRVFVFRQIEVNGLDYYMHFACDEDLNLLPASLLTEYEHQELLAYE